MNRKIQCSILTPEEALYEGEIAFAVVQAYNGEMGFLFNHTPLISELGVGEVRLRDENFKDSYFVEGGIVEINDNKLIILAESAVKSEDLKPEEIQSKLKEIESREFDSFSEERLSLQVEAANLKMKLKVIDRLQR